MSAAHGPPGGTLRIGPAHVARVVLLATAGLFAILASGLLVAGVAMIAGSPAGGAWLVAAGAATLAFAELVRRSARPGRSDPLTLLVGEDEVGFERNGEVVDRVRRAEVGLVVLEAFGRAGLLSITVWSPGGDLVGRWRTGWVGKSVLRPWRALRRYGWPGAIEELGKVRKLSPDAPSWVHLGEGSDGVSAT